MPLSNSPAALERVILQAIRELRLLPRSSQSLPYQLEQIVSRYSGAFSALARQLVIDGVALLPHHRPGKGTFEVLFGERSTQSLWPDLSNVIEPHSLNTDELLVLPLIPQSIRRSATPLAYMCFRRKLKFEEGVAAALEEICSFVADDIFEQYSSLRLTRLSMVPLKLRNLLVYQTKPGTILSVAVGTLHRALFAHASIALTVAGSEATVEYYASGNWNRAMYSTNSATLTVMDENLLLLFRREALSTWVDGTNTRPLADLFSPYVPTSVIDWTYLIAPILDDHEPIGAFIFQFPHGTVPPMEVLEPHIEAALLELREPIKYMHQRRAKDMIVQPIYKSRDTRVADGLVFVMMPFAQPWSERIWERILKPFLELQGLTPIRGDDLYGQDIMEDVWKGILSSQFTIADVTGRNPNVFYELGIAHAIGKPVVLLTQSVNDIPFDLNRYRHIVYEDNLDGYEILRKSLAQTIRTLLVEQQASPPKGAP